MKQIVKIELRKIDSFKDHQFRVENDELGRTKKKSLKRIYMIMKKVKY